MEQNLILIDSHVHIYDCFNIRRFFESALNNFNFQCIKAGFTNFIGILFLTETKNDNYFTKIKGNLFNKELIELFLKPINNNEEHSLVYNYNDNYLVLISGKQIITSEKIEVLALGTTKNLDYGESLIDSIIKIKSIGALPVLPWGVGKWFGKRGKIIANFIENCRDVKYFLGDNSGRSSFLLFPKQFRIANKKGIRILRGSDPLPINSQEKKVGSFGFYIKSNLDLNYPCKDVNKILLNLRDKPNNFGKS